MGTHHIQCKVGAHVHTDTPTPTPIPQTQNYSNEQNVYNLELKVPYNMIVTE